MDCLLLDANWNCSFLQKLLQNQSGLAEPHKTYIEIGGFSPVRQLTSVLLVHALGDTHAATNVRDRTECQAKNRDQDVSAPPPTRTRTLQLFVFYWQQDPREGLFRCYKTSVYRTVARSPAFDIPGKSAGPGRRLRFVRTLAGKTR